MNSIIRANDLDVGYDNRTVVRDLNINALRGQTFASLVLMALVSQPF